MGREGNGERRGGRETGHKERAREAEGGRIKTGDECLLSKVTLVITDYLL